MKRVTIIFGAAIVLFSACGGGSHGEGKKSGGAVWTGEAITASPGQVEDLSEAIKADLRTLREEEKLARDVYLTLYDRWGLKIHSNISAAEQTHMDGVAAVLAAYGLADPVTTDQVGTFTDPAMADLYAKLVATGLASSDASLAVGATIEDLDISDILRMKTETTDAYTLQVLAILECGSRNHLRSFHGQLASRGLGYEAKYIDADLLATILAADREKCGE
jgi:hypothetical protein